MGKKKSSHRWLQEHFNDHYVQQAQQMGYRSRATFKLLELQEQDKLIKPGMVVVDLGAAPGGWSQVIKPWVGSKGAVFALDILDIDPLEGVEFVQGDFTEQAVLDQFLAKLDGRQVDVVLSDMAPNMSGTKVTDQTKSMYLVELAVDFALQALKPGGCFVTKIFQGSGFDQIHTLVKQNFKSVKSRKPKASRPRSPEIYLVAQGRGKSEDASFS